MTKRELVRSALAHQEVTPVPYHLVFTPPVEAVLLEHFGIDSRSDGARDALNRALGNALLRTSVVPQPELQSDGTVRDGFDVVWQQAEVNRGAPAEGPLRQPRLAGYEFPSPEEPTRFEALARRIEGNEDLYVAVFVGDLFERACFLRGAEEFLLDLVVHPGFTQELFERTMDYILATMDEVAKLRLSRAAYPSDAAGGPFAAQGGCDSQEWRRHLPVDCVFLSDDYGDQRGLLMSPATWRELIAPELRRFCQRARDLRLTPALHSCGNVRQLLPELIDLGFEIIHPLQPEALDVVEVKRALGDRFTIYGALDTQRVLPEGSPDDVRALVAQRINELAPGGGFILGPAMKIQHDVPMANLLALIDACQNQQSSL